VLAGAQGTTLSALPLTPSASPFNPAVTSYSFVLQGSLPSYQVQYTVTPGAKVEMRTGGEAYQVITTSSTGALDARVVSVPGYGSTETDIRITSTDSSVVVYSLIAKQTSTDTLITSLVLGTQTSSDANAAVTPLPIAFASSTYNYDVTVPSTTRNLLMTVTLSGASAQLFGIAETGSTYQVTTSARSGGYQVTVSNLPVGTSMIRLTVRQTQGTETTSHTYTFFVHRTTYSYYPPDFSASPCLNAQGSVVTCGGGLRTRTVTCVDSTGAIAADQSQCLIQFGPAPLTEACAAVSCGDYVWQATPTGVCECATGKQNYNVFCSLASAPTVAVADSLCAGVTRPSSRLNCASPLCYDWAYTTFMPTQCPPVGQCPTFPFSLVRKAVCTSYQTGAAVDPALCAGQKVTQPLTQQCQC